MSIFKSICTITFTIFTLLITTNITTSAETTSTIDINEYTQAMQPGWNLGNTYDAVGTDETAWGNPFVTKELIDTIASEGFNSIRIPITFDQRMSDAPDYTIDEEFLSRVEQTINWSLDAGMHVMINVHHDSWIWLESGMVNDHDATVARYEAIWTQLSQRFKDYPVELMFESINEPRFSTPSDEESQQFINELNDIFYDVVRQSGGKNDIRPLVLPTHHTASDQGKLDALATYMEQLHDPNIIATVHYYGFWPFSVNIAGHTRFDQATKDEIHQVFDRVHDTFIKNGIPVVIGEFGLLGFDRHTGVIQQGEKLKFFEHMIHYAQQKELVHMLWDNGQHLNRTTHEWQDEELFSMMQTSWSTRSAVPEENFIYLKKGEAIQDRTISFTLHGKQFNKITLGDTALTNGEDYTISENEVTFTANFLQSLVEADTIGIQNTVTVHFNDGFQWDIDMITYDTPFLQNTTGTTEEFLIPIKFNGDQLATMEAYYADSSIAGPQNWTAFKEFDYTFSPNYENGTIRIQENFFNETEDGEIHLTFHFWSGETVEYTLLKNGSQITGISTQIETIDINDYTQAMQPGWNLGNTYDAVGTDETAWGNPFVTKELIDTIASEGFNSIRIPITFDQRMSDAPDYTIDEEFLSRVEQTINWSLDAGMHVMINVHHDSWVWLESGMVNDHDATVARYEAIWTQLSQRFKDYPVELMFESINEPRFSTPSDEESQQFINELNDIFYDVVRQSGGKNDIRPLVLPTHHTASDQGKLDALATYMEQLHDPNIIATVHYYGFWPFSVNIAGHTRFDQATKDEIHQVFDRVHDTFIKNGIPVVIGEFGLLGFDRHTGVIQQGEKLKFFEHMIHYAQEKELVHMLWDNGQHLNRTTLEWQDEELFSMMQTSWSTRSAHVHDNFIYLKQNNEISAHAIPIMLNGTTFDKMVMNDTELTEGVDYTFADSTVTFTASFLSTIMNDNNTGIIETVTLHFSDGFTWDIDIISYTTPLLQDTTGTTKEFLIPTAFNGDQLATMEAYYADGTNAGPQNWTGFKEFDYTFSPNYENGTIRIQENFFKETEDEEIVLTFHFWSGEQITYYIEKSGDQVIGRATDQPIETPTKPSTPSEPSANDDNSVDKTPEDTNNNDSNPPSNTVTDDTSLNNEENGSTLPNTATSMFAYILIGLLVISIGFITMFIAKKRKISPE